MTGQVSCANAVSRGRPSSDPGCDCGQVPFRCVFSSYCILGHRWCQYHHPLLHPSHTHSHFFFIGRTESINWRLTAYRTFTADVLYVQSGTYAFGPYMLCVLYFFDKNREQREKMRTCGAVQFSGCSWSLCRAAGCAYLLPRSVEQKELEMSWKGSKSLFSIPMLPTSLNTSQPSPPLKLPSARLGPAPPRPCLLRVRAPSMRLARLPSCRGSAVVSCRPEGLSRYRGKKSLGIAKVWWHNTSLGRQLQGLSTVIVFTVCERVYYLISYRLFRCVSCERRLVNWHHAEQAALSDIRTQDI